MITSAFIHNIKLIRYTLSQDSFGTMSASSTTPLPNTGYQKARVEKWAGQKSVKFAIDGIEREPSWIIYLPNNTVTPQLLDDIQYNNEVIGWVQAIIPALKGTNSGIDHYELYIVNGD
jgi:hypothetical protein